MFGRRRKSIGERLLGRSSRFRGPVTSATHGFSERLPGKLDSAAAGALLLGMGNWLTTSLFNFDAVQAVAGKKSMSRRSMYGLIGLSGLYATLRGGRRAA